MITTEIENPWHRLPLTQPYVLPEDQKKVQEFNEKKTNKEQHDHVLHLDLVPEAFVGRPDAPVVILGNNPGVKNEEAATYRRQPEFIRRMRNNLLHQLSKEFPFLYLDPDPRITPLGKDWWEKKLQSLFSEFASRDIARSVLARSILAVEFFPYVSHRFAHSRLYLPSQEYSFDLVRKAVSRHAVIVLTRGEGRWLNRVPELKKHDRLVRLKERQKAPISPGNCRDNGYRELVRAIKAAENHP